MPTPIDSLGFIPGVNLTDDLYSADEIKAAEALIVEWVSARNPTFDLSEGTSFYETMVRPMAQFYLFVRSQADALRQTQSLSAVQANPDLASDAIVDSILSNFLISRRTGEKAIGAIKVMVSLDAVFDIASGTTFTSTSGLAFVTTQAWRVQSSTSDSEHLMLYPVDTNRSQFYFLIPVEAADVGSQYVLVDRTQFDMSPKVSSFISAFSFGSFLGGTDQESNTALIARVPEAMSARNLVSPRAIKIGLAETFPSAISVGVTGMSSAAQHRGSDNVFGIKSGGFVDVWVRTGSSLSFADVELTALREADVSVTADGMATYSVLVDATILPGHYFATQVRPADNPDSLGGYLISEQVKGVASSPHRIKSAATGAYSRYGTTRVFFLVPAAVGQISWPETLLVRVKVAGQDGISEIQDLLSDPEVRPACADYLARAATPCFVSLSPITIHAAGAVDRDAIRAGIFSAVNSLAAGESLNLDSLVYQIRSFEGVSRVEMPLRAAGRIFSPGGETVELSSANALEIPDRGDIQVVPDSCAFFLDVDSIYLNVISDF